MISSLQQQGTSLPFAGVPAGLDAVLFRWLLESGLLFPGGKIRPLLVGSVTCSSHQDTLFPLFLCS